ncbi:DUF6588 family protein [Nibrella viscosa]
MKTGFLLGLSMLLLPAAHGQRVESFLGTYKGQNATGYLQPFADALPAMLQSGYSQDARVDSSFHLYIGLVVFAALPTDAQRQFTATTEGAFTPVQPATVPTIFGDTRSVIVNGDNGTSYVFSGGLNTRYLPLAAPQLTLGSLYGTELNLRYFASDFGKNFGKVSLIGGGIRHSLSQYFHPRNLDLTLAYAEQQFKIGTVLNVRSRQLMLEAGQHWKGIAYYGFAGYLMSKTDIHYAYSAEASSQVNLSLKNKNALIAGAGFSVKVWKIKLNANARYAGSIVATGGLGLDF